MTFPSGGPGYPQQGGAQPHQPAPNTGGFPPQAPPPSAPASAENPVNLGLLLALAVALLGLVQYFIGFSDEATGVDSMTRYLLVGGLLAGLYALPKAPRVLPFAALFSVIGALGTLDLVIQVPSDRTMPGIITVILILGILQMLIAVAALLFEHGVLKLPAPKPAAPQGPYGQPYGQQFGHQPPQFQQGPPQQQQHQPPTGAQPQQPSSGPQGTQFNPPVAPPSGPGSGATTYAPQQGQFFSSEPTQATPPPSSPGTPPGGFGEPK
ncbi:hypothetical protein SAMN05421504_106330 [Amycolatopsis xylanica]|uniref:34 kDa antigenic protein n=1 Tax=Amycolatopsis xylanica TaxID=589385 RepID=A0A1H3LSS0_9PSEU|nr:DUF5336 domain-containing protein [Amycolatopsis xylanica]SDY67129.1 hypothetical protein SAMN05421504_106330 [Amycolatopsis xylanica]